MKSLERNNNIAWLKIFKAVAILEALLLLVITFCYGSKIDNQKKIIEEQKQRIEDNKMEILRLRLVEQDFEENKEYIKECFDELFQEREGTK